VWSMDKYFESTGGLQQLFSLERLTLIASQEHVKQSIYAAAIHSALMRLDRLESSHSLLKDQLTTKLLDTVV
jgi:hypothetical protein